MKYITTSLLACACLYVSCGEKETNKETTITKETTVEQSVPAQPVAEYSQCYLQVNGKDTLLLSYYRKGNNITDGEFYWKPFEKDKKQGTFSGTVQANIATAIADVNTEGMTAKEELQFKIEDDAIKVKFGGMEEGKDGIWHYSKGQPTSEQVLEKVKCD